MFLGSAMFPIGTSCLTDFFDAAASQLLQGSGALKAEIPAEKKPKFRPGVMIAKIVENLLQAREEPTLMELPGRIAMALVCERYCKKGTGFTANMHLFYRDAQQCGHLSCGERTTFPVKQFLLNGSNGLLLRASHRNQCITFGS